MALVHWKKWYIYRIPHLPLAEGYKKLIKSLLSENPILENWFTILEGMIFLGDLKSLKKPVSHMFQAVCYTR